MSKYGHYNHQYFSSVEYPKESFLISAISFYQNELDGISLDTELKTLPEKNEYDDTAICIMFNDKKIGYVPKQFKEYSQPILKIIHIKSVEGIKGIRVIGNSILQ